MLRTDLPDDFQGDNRISFAWPKMHSITHLIESIKDKGVTANTSTDSGEALHPQTRKHWQRSNHQPETAEDQVRCFDLQLNRCTDKSPDASDEVRKGGRPQHSSSY